MLDTLKTMRLVKALSQPSAPTSIPAPAPQTGILTTKQVLNLQRGTRGVLAFGIIASVSANVLHSLTRPEAATDPDWKLASAAALSALAPLVLFACIELVSRIPVQSRVLGGIRLAATLLVGGFAGWVSYWHMESVAETLGETGTAKYMYPLIIDGMMLVATISLIELGRLARTVQSIEAIAIAAEEAKPAAPKVTETEKEARKRAGYSKMDRVAKAAWTKGYRERMAKRLASAVPTSPAPAGMQLVDAFQS